MPEPYEMASLSPGFVRSTRNYLREANLINIKRELKREEAEAVKNPDMVTDRDAVLESGLSFMKTLETNGGRNVKMSLTARKVQPSNSYFETYSKMGDIKNRLKGPFQSPYKNQQQQKPSLK